MELWKTLLTDVNKMTSTTVLQEYRCIISMYIKEIKRESEINKNLKR